MSEVEERQRPIGYANPPKHTRFPKGRSGNPHERLVAQQAEREERAAAKRLELSRACFGIRRARNVRPLPPGST